MQNIKENILQTKCKSCGAMAEFSPDDQQLKCIFCGDLTYLDLTPATPVENNYEEWINKSIEDTDDEKVSEILEVKCSQCGANTSVAPNITSALCVFCNTPLILNEAKITRIIKPDYILPFKVPKKAVVKLIRAWSAAKRFIPLSAKNIINNVENIKGVYLPAWTFDVSTSTDYSGETGETTTQSKRMGSSEYTRDVTTWFPVEGKLNLDFDDFFVNASNSIPETVFEKLQEWDDESILNFKKEFLAGFVTEIYDVPLSEAAQTANNFFKAKIDEEILGNIGGTKSRITNKISQFSNFKFKQVLIPLWICNVIYKNKKYSIYVNGRNGKIEGKLPVDNTSKFLYYLSLILAGAAFIGLILLL